MTIWRLVMGELRHRKVNVAVSVLLIAVAIATLVGSVVLLSIHDMRTEALLTAKEKELRDRLAVFKDDTRKAMLKLGFNVVILPEGQDLHDWYTEDYATSTMPEAYVSTLATAGVVSVRHFLPSLQQPVEWPEKKTRIILVGTRGEVPNLHKSRVKPMVQPVPDGTVTLGYELHRRMGYRPGDRLTLMGKVFTVHACHTPRGNKDDITAWIPLADAQALLKKPGKINAILALECMCVWPKGLETVREEISRVLPGTKVIERGSKALVRAEHRIRAGKEARELLAKAERDRKQLRGGREKLAAIVTAVMLLASVVWIAMLGFTNVRDRRSEIAILRAQGVRTRSILLLFLARYAFVGLLGGVVGFGLGLLSGSAFGMALEGAVRGLTVQTTLLLLGGAIGGATLLSTAAGWLPALAASRQDPADILRAE
jgi:ABC-type lipoprotein release transport system permease subunit